MDAVYLFQGSIFNATLLLFATLSVLTSFGSSRFSLRVAADAKQSSAGEDALSAKPV